MNYIADPLTREIMTIVVAVLIHWAFLAALVSVILHWRVDWWRTEMGRHLMAYQFVVAVVLGLLILRTDFFEESTFFITARVAVFVGVPIVLTQRVWLQIKSQREVRQEVGRHRNDQVHRPDTPASDLDASGPGLEARPMDSDEESS